MTVRAWRVMATAPSRWPHVPRARAPGRRDPPPPELDTFGYGRAVELRFTAGGWRSRGPRPCGRGCASRSWPGEEPTGVQRVLAVADSANGVSAVLPLTSGCSSTPS